MKRAMMWMAALLLLAACGGGSSDDGGGTTSTSRPEPTTSSTAVRPADTAAEQNECQAQIREGRERTPECLAWQDQFDDYLDNEMPDRLEGVANGCGVPDRDLNPDGSCPS